MTEIELKYYSTDMTAIRKITNEIGHRFLLGDCRHVTKKDIYIDSPDHVNYNSGFIARLNESAGEVMTKEICPVSDGIYIREEKVYNKDEFPGIDDMYEMFTVHVSRDSYIIHVMDERNSTVEVCLDDFCYKFEEFGKWHSELEFEFKSGDPAGMLYLKDVVNKIIVDKGLTDVVGLSAMSKGERGYKMLDTTTDK